jgi:hypothetical protein
MANGKLSHDLLSCSLVRYCVATLRDGHHTSNPHKNLLQSCFVDPFGLVKSDDVSAESDSYDQYLAVLSISTYNGLYLLSS